jgi:hypothetical protein
MFGVLLVMNYFLPQISIMIVGAKIATGALVYFVTLRFIVRDGFLISESQKALSKVFRRR